MKKGYLKDLKVTPAEDSEILIEGEIPFDILEVEYKKAYTSTKNKLEVPGFRVGKAPEHIVKANINELVLLDNAAEEVFKNEYPEIIDHLKLFPIDRPKIEILKLAPQNPLVFKMSVAVMPKINLPNYKKIVKEGNDSLKKNKVEPVVEVTEKEIDTSVEEVRKMYAHQEHHRKNPNKQHDESESFEHLMPEINDEFVKKLGDFKDVQEFRSKLKENIKNEKNSRQKEKSRLTIIDKILEDFNIELPKVFIDSELDKMTADLNNRIISAGTTPAEYYKQTAKTEQDIRNEWRPDAIKRVKSEILLAEIAKKESLKPEKEAVDKETTYLTSYYKDTDPERARSYVEHILTNDKVFEFLENL